MQSVKFHTQSSNVLIRDHAHETGFQNYRIATMPVRVNGIEAKHFTAEMKAVHQFVSTGAYAVTLDTARAHGVNCRKSLVHTEQLVSNL